MKRIIRQPVKSLKRLKVSDHPSFKEEKCKGGCGRKLGTLYYVWVNEKTKEKFCTFCYSETPAVRESEFNTMHTINLPKGYPRGYGLPDTPTYIPGEGVDDDVETRAKLDGFMPLCENCTKECKVPRSPNVTTFFCTDHFPIKILDLEDLTNQS